MSTQLRESFERILSMYLVDEAQHFEENGNPDGHIYRDLLNLQGYLDAEPHLVEAAQGILDDEDDTGCEDCTVISMSSLEKLRTAVTAANPNVQS